MFNAKNLTIKRQMFRLNGFHGNGRQRCGCAVIVICHRALAFRILLRPLQVCCFFFGEFVFKFLSKIYVYIRYIYAYIPVIYKPSALKNKGEIMETAGESMGW